MDKTKAIFIVGPTASGKTSLGVEVAKYFNGEVISADSMQIYKHMDIATAKPTENEMQGIPHHLIDFIEPDELYSVAKYKLDAMKQINAVASRGKMPVIVGGTGLYIDTLLYNTEFLDFETDEKLRNDLSEKCDKCGCDKLWDELYSIDPEAAMNIHRNNKKKIVRALEIFYQTGKTLTEQNALSRVSGSVLDPVIIGLNADNREYLYDRINKRVDLMISDGLEAEAKEYFDKYGTGTSVQAIGYKELLPYFKGERTLEQCIDNLKMQTRRYAKRQLTWFRKNESIKWIYIDKYINASALAQAAIEIITENMTSAYL